jgi:uncharacterized integral membrane protein
MRRDDTAPPPDRGGWKESRQGPSGKLIVSIVAIVILVLFVLQNTNEAQVNFLFFDGRYPLWMLIVIGAVLGFIAGWFVAAARGRRRLRRAAGGG